LGKRVLLAGLALWLFSADPLSAQYFGRNKVQYEDFDFQVLTTPHFDLHYYPAERGAALIAARMAERWYARLSRALDHTLSERTPIVLYASQPHFTQTTVLPGLLPDGVGGFTDHLKGRVVLPFAAGLGETDHVLGHELVHAFQRDILQQNGRSMALLPLWFLEGMAEFLTAGEIDANTGMWIRDAVDQKRLPPIRQLHDPRWFPYRYGQALWAFLAGTYGEDIAARALASKAGGGGIGRLVAVTGVKEPALTEQWHAALRRDAAGRAGQGGARPDPQGVLITARGDGGRLNLGPALSPDGAHLVFLSERDRYSVDMFLADGVTGRVRRKIVSAAANPRFDSLQFIDSAGDWDAGGARFAFAALREGAPVITVLGMPDGDVERERAFPDLDQIFDPTWAPSGGVVAFSALAGGTTDLYTWNLETDAIVRLTSDAFADRHPAWSPDGRILAFSTDRFTSTLDVLTFGEYRLAALDFASGDIRELPSVVGAKNIDPQWTGGDLYFVSDAGGTSNVFRLEMSSGRVHRMTDVRTGVSGVAALSPTLSVATAAGRLTYSVYADGAYEIRTMPLAGGAVHQGAISTPSPAYAGAGAPSDIGAAQPFSSARYRGGLSLDGIGQPYLSAGGGALGGFFRAGMSVSFSDLLQQRQLQTAIQVGTRARDFAVQSAFVQRRARWTWGMVGAQMPAVFGSTRSGSPADGSTIVRETLSMRQTHRQGMALAAYPFSRFQRLELTGGIHAVSFTGELRTRSYTRRSGALVNEETTRVPAPRGVMLAESAAALVYDTSVTGATAPVLGRRSRFELAPTVGDLSFVTLTADYRRYFMPVSPLTVAVRLHHVGRYGADAGDARLLPLVWTLRDLVRGYALREATGRPCTASACEPLTDLGTRRLFVGNIELRAPLWGPLGMFGRSGTLPVDAFVFGDLGGFTSIVDRQRAHTTLRSAGAGARVNAAGFVFEFAAARPFDRARDSWTVVVNFRPGF
jgi:hypothetical protein